MAFKQSKPSDEEELLGPTEYDDAPPSQYQPEPIPYPAPLHPNQVYASASQVIVTQPYPTHESMYRQQLEPVPDYLCLSIFNLLCCCFCLGIAAILYSSQANEMKHINYQLAMEKSATARNLNIAGVVCGLILLTCNIVYVLVTTLQT